MHFLQKKKLCVLVDLPHWKGRHYVHFFLQKNYMSLLAYFVEKGVTMCMLFCKQNSCLRWPTLLKRASHTHTHTHTQHTITHAHTHNHTGTRTGKSVASEKDSICSSFLGGSVAAPFMDDIKKRTEKKKRENKEIKRER